MKERAIQTKTPEAAPMIAASPPKAVLSSRPSAHPILQLQRVIGNQAIQHCIQAKLTISQRDDPYELEADDVADKIMRMSDMPGTMRRKCACGGAVGPDGECAECHKKRLSLQRKAEDTQLGANQNPSVPSIVNEALRSPGRPLDSATRFFMESLFGNDFSQVRVHEDRSATKAASSIQARAFATGHDIVFGSGQYAPSTPDGKRLLAHELSHVVQQQERPLTGVLQRQEANAEPASPTPTTASPSDDAGKAPASTNAAAVPPSAADAHSRDSIKKALDSGDPSDVKEIKNFAAASLADKFILIRILLSQGWVGPSDEYALEAIWGSFGESLIVVASANFELWNDCIERGAELEDLPAVQQIRTQFVDDVKALATRTWIATMRWSRPK